MASSKLISESVVLAAAERGEKELHVLPGVIVTPLALDAARATGIAVIRSAHATPSPPRPAASSSGTPSATPATTSQSGTLAIGSDHGGFELKKELSKYLGGLGWNVVDVGTNSNARCDYPDFAFAVARAVAMGKASVGIMIDGAGPGSAIVANKVPGIRAACGSSEFVAWNARAHNDCNVLTLGSRATGIEICKRIVLTFLDTDFEGGRHLERVDKIRDVEGHFSIDR